MEVIIVNDGSTDDSLEKIKRYENDKRIKIIDKKNEGLTSTRNVGLNIAKGKYIYFMDSDDYLEDRDDIFEILYEKSEKENLDILIFDYYRDYDVRKDYIASIKTKNELVEKRAFTMEVIKLEGGVSVWCKLIKRSLFLENNIFFPQNIFLGEDFIVTLKIVYYAKKIGKLNHAFYNYVQHENQGAKNIKNMLKDTYNYINEILNFYEDKKEMQEYSNTLKLRLYEKYLKKENSKIEGYKKLKLNFLQESKELYNCEMYKKWKIEKKLKFFIRTKFFI